MKKQNLFSLLVIVAIFLVPSLVSLSAEVLSGITFPIPELGNCKTESACRTYCDDGKNMSACVSFAKQHKLISDEDAAKAEKFAELGGPGGCTDQKSCDTYCEDTKNIDACIAFAEKTGMLSGAELDKAHKAANALRNGVSLPGGCKNSRACESYCKNVDHIPECLAFAEKSGMLSGKELEDAKKFAPQIARGETPGKCSSKDTCDAYCKDDTHIAECFNFAEKNGLVSKEDAEIYHKTGGKGPNGCSSKDACESFCNKQENAETCFRFVEEHDLMPPEKLKEAKDGLLELKNGLKVATPEVISCLTSKLGAENYAKITEGTFIPGPSAGEAIKGCFEGMIKMAEERMKQIPEEAKACLVSAFGDDVFDKMKKGDMAEEQITVAMQNCAKNSMQEEIRGEVRKNIEGAAGGKLPEGIDIKQFSGEAENCLKQLYGEGYESKIRDGSVKQSDVQPAVAKCIQGKIQAQIQDKIMGQAQKNMPKGGEDGIPEGVRGDGSYESPTGMGPTPEQIEKMKQQFGGGDGIPNIPAGFGPNQ